MAMVTVDGLECETSYTIKAGGTLNGNLVGPTSSYDIITTNTCPESRRGEADDDDIGN